MGSIRSRAMTAFAVSLLAVAGFASRLSGQNLLDDPSFEQPKDRDRWGLVFSKWAGNIYDGPAQFEASRIAHSGKYSCMMVGDVRTKIRMTRHRCERCARRGIASPSTTAGTAGPTGGT